MKLSHWLKTNEVELRKPPGRYFNNVPDLPSRRPDPTRAMNSLMPPWEVFEPRSGRVWYTVHDEAEARRLATKYKMDYARQGEGHL